MYIYINNINMLGSRKWRLQFVGKAETEFRIHLNNHHRDLIKVDAILVSRHFAKNNHNFNCGATFIISGMSSQ